MLQIFLTGLDARTLQQSQRAIQHEGTPVTAWRGVSERGSGTAAVVIGSMKRSKGADASGVATVGEP